MDSATGAELWHTALTRRANATPMTYRSSAGRQFIVIATGGGEDASLVAFALEGPPTGRGEQIRR
jgi:quinoprotein glucose dehydrogenase